LAEVTKATSLRFWGKILNKGSDYYVVEGKLVPSIAESKKEFESEGQGVNALTFWVTHSGTI